jgi:glutathione S-transferase
MTAELWYWSFIPGRGEFVRLALEAGSIPYRDCAREQDDDALIKDMASRVPPPFAPPYLVIDGLVIAQTGTILAYLGDTYDLGGKTPAQRLFAQQLQLTIADVVTEAHDVHHPVSVSAYYDEQKSEAMRAAQSFRDERIPKFLDYFERALDGNDWLTGSQWTYADLSLFQMIGGLRYAFPRRMKAVEHEHPGLTRLAEAVAALPELQDYLHSDRRLAFNEDGILRHYPELDPP